MSNDDYADDILKRAKMLLSFMSPSSDTPSSQSNNQYNSNNYNNDQSNTQLNKVSVIKGSTIITTYNDVRHIAIRGSFISIDDIICQVSKEGEWTNKCITLTTDYPGDSNFDAIITKADNPEKVKSKAKNGSKKKSIGNSNNNSISNIKQAVANLDTILESSTESDTLKFETNTPAPISLTGGHNYDTSPKPSPSTKKHIKATTASTTIDTTTTIEQLLVSLKDSCTTNTTSSTQANATSPSTHTNTTKNHIEAITTTPKIKAASFSKDYHSTKKPPVRAMSSGSTFPQVPTDTSSPLEHYRAASSSNLTSSSQPTPTTTNNNNNFDTEERHQQVIRRVKLKLKEDRERDVERQRLESQRVYEQMKVNEEKAARLKVQVNERLARRIQEESERHNALKQQEEAQEKERHERHLRLTDDSHIVKLKRLQRDTSMRLKQREAKVKADEDERQVALKERIQALLAEKERQTYKYMRQTRKRDDQGASVVDDDGDGDEAGDVSMFTHDNTCQQRQQHQLIHSHYNSYAAEGIGIATSLPSDTPMYPRMYSDRDFVNTTEHILVHTPDCNNIGTDSTSGADSDSLDEESLPSVAVQSKATTACDGNNQLHHNKTNTTAGNLSSTEVTPTASVATPEPEPEPLFQMVMSIDDLRRKRPKQLLPSPSYTPDNSIYMPHSSTHISPTSAKSTSVPFPCPSTTIIPTPTHTTDPFPTTTSRRPSTHQGRLSTDSSTLLCPSTALNKHQSSTYIPHTSSNSVRSSRGETTTRASPTAYTDIRPASPSQTLHILHDSEDTTSPPYPSNLQPVSQLASTITSAYSNNSTRTDLTSVVPKTKNKKGFRRLVPIPLRPYQPV